MKNFKIFLTEAAKIGQKIELIEDFKNRKAGEIGMIKNNYNGLRYEIGFPKNSKESSIYNEIVIFLQKDFEKFKFIWKEMLYERKNEF